MLKRLWNDQPYLAFGCALMVLLAAYLPTLQTIPNGSDNYYMIDVGETQVVLNVWGTLHATGYPLYVMLSSALVALLKLVGVSAAAAPAVTSLLWGSGALALLYALLLHLTRRIWLAAAALVLFGLARTIWIHNVIAEIYSLGLFFLLALLLLALWRTDVRRRIYALALIGGLGVAHHRAIIMVAPALLYAVWPQLTAAPRRIPRVLLLCLLLGLLGLLPYVYLPLREWSGAGWVYGEPGTWQGLLDQFWGREADRFVGLPATWEGLRANFDLINGVLLTDAAWPGVLLGLVGLLLGLRAPETRRAAVTLLLSAGVAYAFHVLLYRDILSALIMPILVSFAVGWVWLADAALRWAQKRAHCVGASHESLMRRTQAGIFVLAGLYAAWLVGQNGAFIGGLTSDPRGLETIRAVQQTPPGTTLMIPWGPRHFAAGFARDVLGLLASVTLVDHKAHYAASAQSGTLVTPDYTLYTFPLAWWEARLGGRVYLQAAAPFMVQIRTTPTLVEGQTLDDVTALEYNVMCADDDILLHVLWATPEVPARDMSVYVHLLDAAGTRIAQGDQAAPVYGWYPLTRWTAGESVRDVYMLPRLAGAAQIRFGLYYQDAVGAFVNQSLYEAAVQCDE
ncbi:MAG: DUF2723 domain-containing protein [Chloroflexi bacterium]|nr:DUF2723 domain-containing protein [Chloroflexota bacterium]